MTSGRKSKALARAATRDGWIAFLVIALVYISTFIFLSSDYHTGEYESIGRRFLAVRPEIYDRAFTDVNAGYSSVGGRALVVGPTTHDRALIVYDEYVLRQVLDNRNCFHSKRSRYSQLRRPLPFCYRYFFYWTAFIDIHYNIRFQETYFDIETIIGKTIDKQAQGKSREQFHRSIKLVEIEVLASNPPNNLINYLYYYYHYFIDGSIFWKFTAIFNGNTTTVRDVKQLLAKQMNCHPWQIEVFRKDESSDPGTWETVPDFVYVTEFPMIAVQSHATRSISCYTVCGKSLNIVIDPLESIEKLGQLALNQLHKQAPHVFPLTSKVKLVFEGKYLETKQSLLTAGLHNGASVLLLPSTYSLNDSIIVSRHNGLPLLIEASSTDRVMELKTKIFNHTGHAPELQVLFRDNHEMGNDELVMPKQSARIPQISLAIDRRRGSANEPLCQPCNVTKPRTQHDIHKHPCPLGKFYCMGMMCAACDGKGGGTASTLINSVVVHRQNGPPLLIEVSSNDRLIELKDKICKLTGYAPEQQILLRDGCKLANDTSANKISQVALSLNIRGGSGVVPTCQPCNTIWSPKISKIHCSWSEVRGDVRYRCSCRAHTDNGCCLLCAAKMWWADGTNFQPVFRNNNKLKNENIKLMEQLESLSKVSKEKIKKEKCIERNMKVINKKEKAEEKFKEKQHTNGVWYGCKCVKCSVRDLLSKRDDPYALELTKQFEKRDAVLAEQERYVKYANKRERRELCRQQIRQCAINNKSTRSWHYNWYVGSHLSTIGTIPCCKFAFAKFYGLSPTSVDRLIDEMKRGDQHYSIIDNRSINDKRYQDMEADMRAEAEMYGFTFTNEMKAKAFIQNTPAARDCHAWLKSYIKLVGDPQPNRDDEIHLDEAASYKQIHAEYMAVKLEEHGSSFKPLQYEAFRILWKNCFQHVKIREYKQVESKCVTCANLTLLRTQAKTSAERDELTRLQTWHRITFMGERKAYYERRQKAGENPKAYLSTIGDGMQQGHNSLPHMSGSGSQIFNTLDTVIQGILVHHQRIVFYRHFANVGKGPNIAIFAWLSELEKVVKASPNKKLPDTIYHQIDGGSENIAQTNIAIAEWLVAKGLTKKVILTRLPVGHTHEDIDAMFAVLWKALRGAFVFSPQEQKRKGLEAFAGKVVEWHDLYVIPDFVKFFSPSVNKIERYARRSDDFDWTQLQFIVEAYEGGLRTRYRAYAQDEVIELWRADVFKAKRGDTLAPQIAESISKYVPVNVTVSTFPEESEKQFTLLKQTRINQDGINTESFNLPSGPVPPMEFKASEDSSNNIDRKTNKQKLDPWEQLEAVLKHVRHSWSLQFKKGVTEWEEFKNDHFPKERNAADYIRNHPNKYHVPFADLFATSDVNMDVLSAQNNSSSQSDRSSLIQSRAGPSVRHNGNRQLNIPPRTIMGHEQLGLLTNIPSRVRIDMTREQQSSAPGVTEAPVRRNIQRRPTRITNIEKLKKDQLKLELRRLSISFRNDLKQSELLALLMSTEGMDQPGNQEALLKRINDSLDTSGNITAANENVRIQQERAPENVPEPVGGGITNEEIMAKVNEFMTLLRLRSATK